jgi:hypothetical protein
MMTMQAIVAPENCPTGSLAKGDEARMLCINFAGYSGKDFLEPVSWEEFFRQIRASGRMVHTALNNQGR